MARYANMRRTFFAKYLETNGSGNLMAKMANNQSTRARVVNAVSSSKAVGDATKDAKTKEIWEKAGNNAFEHADEEENEEMEDFIEATA